MRTTLACLILLLGCAPDPAPAPIPLDDAPPQARATADAPAAVEKPPADAAPTPIASDLPPRVQLEVGDALTIGDMEVGKLPLGDALPALLTALTEMEPSPGPYDLRLADNTAITTRELALIQRTMAEAGFHAPSLYLAEDGPLDVKGPVSAEATPPGDPRVGSVQVVAHVDTAAAWARASLAWTEATTSAPGPHKGHRPELHVPLAGDEGCTLLRSGPRRGLAPGIDARLKVFGLEASTPLGLMATPHTAVTDRLALALALQKRGWAVQLAGDAEVDADSPCKFVARTADDVAGNKDRFLLQKAAK